MFKYKNFTYNIWSYDVDKNAYFSDVLYKWERFGAIYFYDELEDMGKKMDFAVYTENPVVIPFMDFKELIDKIINKFNSIREEKNISKELF